MISGKKNNIKNFAESLGWFLSFLHFFMGVYAIYDLKFQQEPQTFLPLTVEQKYPEKFKTKRVIAFDFFRKIVLWCCNL